jgi:tetratricopeptide (TPR) repeat protein
MPNAPVPRRKTRFLRGVLLAVAGALLAASPLCAEKVLMYDEEKGIIFLDKDAPPEKAEAGKEAREPAGEKPGVKRSQPGTPLGRLVDTSLIRGKKKDPSSVYFESGLQFFKAGNFTDALRLFVYADSTDPQPKYALWVGKTYRQLGRPDQHIFIMKKILGIYPESDVADDALFEIAFHYQAADDYVDAAKTYTQLAEQYPFGTSFSNGEDFREVAKKQKQMMRSEMISTLRLLGYNGSEVEDLYSSFQQSRGLPVTGLGDAKTVKAIKAEYREFLKNEEKKAAHRLRVARYMKWGAALIGLNLLLIATMLAMRASAAGKKKHMAALHQALADLSRKNL